MQSGVPVYRRVQGMVGKTSYGLILPKTFAENLEIVKGTFVKVSQEGTRIIIEKAETNR
ncbi:MAG: AbrB/MazE/SpoVT family DNA-binding domain-containing protein [Nitrososphaerales archaeon]